MTKFVILCGLVLLIIVNVFDIANALMVSGTIVDGNGHIVKGIRVEVRNDNSPFPGTLIENAFTDNTGVYKSIAVNAGDNPFIRVSWEFPLLPAEYYNNRVIRLVDRGTGNPYTPQTTFIKLWSSPVTNISSDTIINLALSDPQPVGLSTLLKRIQESLDYYRNNRGTVVWNPNFDVPVHISDDNQVDYEVNKEIYLSINTFDGSGGDIAPYTIYHEMAHLVHENFSGTSLNPNCPLHTVNSENNVRCAIVEGWAYYVAELTGREVSVPDNAFANRYEDTGNDNWRGRKVVGNGFGPIDSGFDNSGEIVEGAVSGFMFDYSNANSFADIFKVMHDDKPFTFFDFSNELVRDAGGAGTARTLNIFQFMQRHGIVYSRLKFNDPVFDETEPPDVANPDEGNFKKIDGKVFLRGKVNGNFDPLSNADLHVQNTIDIDQARVGWKAAANGANDDLDTAIINLTFSFTPAKELGLLTSDEIELDTTTMGGDGDYDLIVQGRNENHFFDNFDPDWKGDTDQDVDTDEKYLKRIGAWFDVDRNAKTNPDDEGKVIVDNTAPEVSNFKPQ